MEIEKQQKKRNATIYSVFEFQPSLMKNRVLGSTGSGNGMKRKCLFEIDQKRKKNVCHCVLCLLAVSL